MIRNPSVKPTDLPDNLLVYAARTPRIIVADLVQRDAKGCQSSVGSVSAIWGMGGHFRVDWAQAPRGYGPLLYDVVMELAGDKGLIPHRESVSYLAKAVWKHYRDERPDVINKPANVWASDELDTDYSPSMFHLSPLSRVYYATGTRTLDALRNAGKLQEKIFDYAIDGFGTFSQSDSSVRNPADGLQVVEDVSPLVYYRSGAVKRLAIIDPAAEPPKRGWTYFAPQERRIYTGANGRRLKTPRIEVEPGAAPGVVAFLDYHLEGWVYIDYVRVRPDYQGQGLARQLVQALVAKLGRDQTYHFGKVMSPGIWKLKNELAAAGYDVLGHPDF